MAIAQMKAIKSHGGKISSDQSDCFKQLGLLKCQNGDNCQYESCVIFWTDIYKINYQL